MRNRFTVTNRSARGVALLLLVVVVGSVSFIMVFRGLWRSIAELDSAVTFQQGRDAFFIANGCLEESLRRLDLDSGYVGDSNMSLLGGSCTITIIPAGSSRTITAIGRTGDGAYTATITAGATLATDSITMTSWRLQN